MISFIDSFLNRFTMYQIALYETALLLVAAFALASFGLLPFSPIALAFSVSVLLAACAVANAVFSWAFDAPSNFDSVVITALILALIISPPTALIDAAYLSLALWAAALAIASKYILAIQRRHLFNPAAIGVVLTSLVLGQSATWWVGTPAMLFFVVIGGLLLGRKIRRFDLVLSFLVVALGLSLATGAANPVLALSRTLLSTATVFFATVMLTEPFTTPPTRVARILYGAAVGALFLPQIHFGSLYLSPELALVVGNILSYALSAKEKLVLTLVNRIKLSPSSYEFVFATPSRVPFTPGEYLEWTLAHDSYDMRGIRRYFTIASAPSDPDIRIGVKRNDPGSSFKRALFSMRRGDTLVAAARGGDFKLPHDKKKKVALIAGGIGITPFVSMVRHMIAHNERRPVTILYANRNPGDVAYAEVLREAEVRAGIPTAHLFSDSAPVGGKIEKLSAETIRVHIPDFSERIFYVSGPEGMVSATAAHLQALGVPRSRIKKDYFPGFA